MRPHPSSKGLSVKGKNMELPKLVEAFPKNPKGKRGALSLAKSKRNSVVPLPEEVSMKRKLVLQSTQTSKIAKV